MSKRKSLSVVDKVDLLKDVDCGMKKKDISVKFGIPPSTVSTIIKNRNAVMKSYENIEPNRKRSKTCSYETVDEAVLKWIKVVRDQNLPISGPLIKEKALEYAKHFGCDDFQASSGWLDKFKKRHAIKEKVVSGESRSVDDAVCDDWRNNELKKILKDYQSDNIFNVDEMGLFYKCLPNKTLTLKDNDCHGGKSSKDRITVLVGANMSGKEKLRLLVIGKSKNPRVFKNVTSLEVDYRSNKKSWMTSDIFEEWISKLDRKMCDQNRKIALLVDNCPAHPNVSSKLSNVNLIFLPPNTTSKLQPMDQGVIKNLKLHYRKRILRRLIWTLENEETNLHKVIDLRICVAELAKVWENDVLESTIRNCFAKAGFDILPEIEEQDVFPHIQQSWETLHSQGHITDGIHLNEFLTVDDRLIVADYPTDEDILSSITGTEKEIEEIEEIEYATITKPSKNEMREAFETIRRGLQFVENVPDEVFSGLNKCEHFFDEHSIKQAVQQDIRSFFKSSI
ncbi:tigger transposable element-derived protein 6-like [Uloborus diversus]|uniref:tigger transposable element-derived protein 6-like n=1 Tax=Uloborus diversus TaxID=327109 RepID=UPI00240A0BF1|nr:tigger transposable element-derived protein 6-like [Uloborus diversus]